MSTSSHSNTALRKELLKGVRDLVHSQEKLVLFNTEVIEGIRPDSWQRNRDLLRMYADQAKLRDVFEAFGIACGGTIEKEELWALDPEEPAKFAAKYVSLQRDMKQVEELSGTRMEPGDLERRIDAALVDLVGKWEENIRRADAEGIGEDEAKYMESVRDYCWMREKVEYAVRGIRLARAENPASLSSLPNFEACVARIAELDVIFDKALKDRRLEDGWQNSDFWWRFPRHHPSPISR